LVNRSKNDKNNIQVLKEDYREEYLEEDEDYLI